MKRHGGKRERGRKRRSGHARAGSVFLPSSFVLGAFVPPLPLSLSVPLDGPPDTAEDSTPEVKRSVGHDSSMYDGVKLSERREKTTSRFKLSKWFHVLEGKRDNNAPHNW